VADANKKQRSIPGAEGDKERAAKGAATVRRVASRAAILSRANSAAASVSIDP